VAGRTGIGKSIALRTLVERCPEHAILLEDDFPALTLTLAEARDAVGDTQEGGQDTTLAGLTSTERQQLLVSYACSSHYPIVALDETLSALSPPEMARALEGLSNTARNTDRTFIVVSHTEAGLFRADRFVRLADA
jgi:ABC-type thiamine transport system ATPase subunit